MKKPARPAIANSTTERAIPGTRRRVEFKGARIFFPEERSREFNKEERTGFRLHEMNEIIGVIVNTSMSRIQYVRSEF
jgi:hypothetical protein